MIKKLRRQFIVIAVATMFAVMSLILVLVNFANYYNNKKEINGMLDILCHNDATIPFMDRNGNFSEQIPPNKKQMLTPETAYRTRYFAVYMSTSGEAVAANTAHIAAVNETEAKAMGEKIYSTDKTSGRYGVYFYRIVKDDIGCFIVFLDCEDKIDMMKSIAAISVVVGAISLILVFILVSVLSKIVMKPVSISIEKQKQFITDASHEIKTPIAIISANAEVIEMTSGTNEWTTSMRKQIIRLDKLVKNLVMLSRMDEEKPVMNCCEFSISDAVYDTASYFSTLAKSQGKEYIMDIDSDINYVGDESGIRQLVSILADNALKYADDGGVVKVSLHLKNKNVVLQVYNTFAAVDSTNLNMLFDRFYRDDPSRSRETGGYGIGLSIAKAIVEAHKGKIHAKKADEAGIVFVVTL